MPDLNDLNAFIPQNPNGLEQTGQGFLLDLINKVSTIVQQGLIFFLVGVALLFGVEYLLARIIGKQWVLTWVGSFLIVVLTSPWWSIGVSWVMERI